MSYKRKMTREVRVGEVKIGGNNPISVQSMTNTDTRDVEKTVAPVSYTHLDVYKRQRLGIPVVGIVDTNCDPDELDYAIPGNDDAIRAGKLITGAMATAIIEGRQGAEEEIVEEEAEIQE